MLLLLKIFTWVRKKTKSNKRAKKTLFLYKGLITEGMLIKLSLQIKFWAKFNMKSSSCKGYNLKFANTNIPCFIVHSFIALHKCCIFYKLKATPSQQKDYDLIYCHICFMVVVWNQTTISPRYACNGKDAMWN